MRFDDSLDTVLTADMSTPFGAQSAWRQLVDLIGRGRAPASEMAITRLRSIRQQVPLSVRAASARALAFAHPPAALVRLFAEEDLAVSAPVLRMATLSASEWIAMLPSLSPAARSVLRHRRDLADDVGRALETYGPIDFILPAAPVADPTPLSEPTASDSEVADEQDRIDDGGPTTSLSTAPVAVQLSTAGAALSKAALGGSAIVVSSLTPAHSVARVEPEALAVDDHRTDVPQPLASDSSATVPLTIVEPVLIDWTEVIAARPGPVPAMSRIRHIPPAVALPVRPVGGAAPEQARQVETGAAQPESGSDSSFVSIASVALGLPVVVEALRSLDETKTNDPEVTPEPAPLAAPPAAADHGGVVPAESEAFVQVDAGSQTAPDSAVPISTEPASAEPRGPFQISDIVARIDAFQRQRDEEDRSETTLPVAASRGVAGPDREGFQFETDSTGSILWVAGVSRAAVIGVSLDHAPNRADARVDGVASGAFRRRSSFVDARLLIDGQSDAAGQWRISGVPAFDRATGRFTGYRGTARRPRPDERLEPVNEGRSPATDSLRQLVHELRTPTTAIAGFAEMIEGELLGPVSGSYRSYATTIKDQAMGLLGAIDDLDTAARIEAHALDLRPSDVPVTALLNRIVRDLAPLAALRQATIVPEIGGQNADTDLAVRGDDRAVDRLFARLLAALVSAASPAETIAIRVGREGNETVAMHVDRPRALAAFTGDTLLTIDAETEIEAEGAPLLGTGFALRLARNLASELGGSLTIGVDRLTLRLPAAFTQDVGQVSTV